MVKGINGDKAPSPDAFSLDFFQTCWEIIEEDLLYVLHEF